MQSLEDGYGVAGQLLDAFGISAPPVDVVMLACGLGIQIVAISLKVVPGFLWRGEHHPVICVNRNNPRTRQRFTIAHEIGHYVHGHPGVSLRSGCDDFDDERERAMNRFASELLMPADWLQAIYVPGHFIELCRRFNVSKQAMDARLSHLGLEVDTAATPSLGSVPPPRSSLR